MSKSKYPRVTSCRANGSPKAESDSSKPGSWNRRDFIAGVGKGAVGVAVGASLLRSLNLSTAWAAEGTRFASMSKTSSPYGVIASANWQASRVGIDVLTRGGNAIDATIATIFAVAALDFREFAPALAGPTTFSDFADLNGGKPPAGWSDI